MQNKHLYYLDNVRALAMLFGILFHAALGYSPLMHNALFTTHEQNSAVFDIFSLFIHLFRMPLFFMISGYFALMMIKKRGILTFVLNRSKRILLPFLIFLPIVLGSILLIIAWALDNVDNLSPLLMYIKDPLNTPDVKQLPVSTVHLWFLFNLYFFILLTAVLYRLGLFESNIFQKFLSTKVLVIGLPLLITPALSLQHAPVPSADKLYPELWSFGYYGVFFLLGCGLFLKQTIFDELERYKHWLLAASLIMYIYFYSTIPTTIPLKQVLLIASGSSVSLTWEHITVALTEAYIGVFMTFYCLLMGKQFLDKQNTALKFLSDSSYWVYLIHAPILIAIQLILVDTSLNIWLQFIISSTMTLLIGITSYIAFVKYTIIGKLLNGSKKIQNNHIIKPVTQ